MAARSTAASLPGSSKRYPSVHLVLDNVEVNAAGKAGGYYYQLYLNMPATDSVTNKLGAILIGTLGAFKISGAAHHGGPVRLRYGIGRAPPSPRRRRRPAWCPCRSCGSMATRVPGGVIGLGEVRLETSTEDRDS